MKKVILLVCLLAFTLLITNISAKSKQPTATIINNVAKALCASQNKKVKAKCVNSQKVWLKRIQKKEVLQLSKILGKCKSVSNYANSLPKYLKKKKNTLGAQTLDSCPTKPDDMGPINFTIPYFPAIDCDLENDKGEYCFVKP